MKTYFVPDAAKMLGVNEETIRRWIRRKEGNVLKADHSRGRGVRSTLLLEDIVSFANEPPRVYLKSLIFWLETNGIKYRKIDDPTSRNELAKSIQRSAAATGALAALAPAGPLFPIVAGAAGAAAITTAKKKNQKSQVPFIIELIASTNDPTSKDIPNTQNNTGTIVDSEMEEVPVSEVDFDEELKTEEAQHNVANEGIGIKAKIVEEQIKLIKLRQELAQIQAQISVAEGQIEYYNLLLQNG